jgi:ATP sulfurylase
MCFYHVDYSVIHNLRLASGVLFPMPIIFDVSRAQVDSIGISAGKRITLRDGRDDNPLAILTGSFTFLRWPVKIVILNPLTA